MIYIKKTETLTKTQDRKQVKNLLFSWEGKKKEGQNYYIKMKKAIRFYSMKLSTTKRLLP